MRPARFILMSAACVACLLARPVPLLADLADLDKGHRILLEKGFAVNAMAVDQPEIPNWSVFDAGGWNGVDFQFNYFAPSAYLGSAPGNHIWQATYADYAHTSFSQVEAPYASNCLRIQLFDEQDLNDATVRSNTAAWFAAARNNYPNTILSVNQVPFAATDANFRDFMRTSQPDMLMIDSYRWTSDPSQGSWNLLSDWQRHRKFALSGNDGTGAHPIPYGFYAQAIDDYGRVPSESELRFEHFGAWAMGYTMTDDFTYNMNRSYSGVESIYFANGSQQSNPMPSYYQIQSINSEGKNLGPALVRLLSTDVRFINGYNSAGGQNPNPIDIPNWSVGAGDGYLRSYSRLNTGTKNNGYAGDLVLSWFKPLDEGLDGDSFAGERYFSVLNGLTDPTGSSADCRQLIALGYDFGTTGIKSIQRLRRDTGLVEVLPLTQDASGQYVLNIMLDGGTADLFKFNDGAPFVGISSAGLMYWDSDGAAAGNDATSGAGLGGSENWDASSTRWYNGTSNGTHSAGANAVFSGAAGTVTLTAPQTINALTFKTTGYNIVGSTLTLTSSFVTVDTGANATISSELAGGVGLTKVGSGTLNLAGANSYSGITMINAGVLGVASSAFSSEPASPALNITINNGATLRFNATGVSLSSNRNISLGTGGGVIDTSGNNATIAGAISGTSLLKIGSGILILSGSNGYTGGTIVSGGALQISSDTNLGAVPASFTAGNITLDGGTLRFGANLDLSNNRGITLGAGGGTIDTQGFTNPSGYTQPDGIRGNANLTKIGSGTFFMNPTPSTQLNHNWKGNLIIKEGTWKIAERGGLPYNTNDDLVYRPAQVTLDGGTWQIAVNNILVSSLQRGITVAVGGGTIDTQTNLTWGGPLVGSFPSSVLNKIGSGLLQLNNTGTVAAGNYTGSFNINGGTVILNGGSVMGDLAAVNLANTAGVALTFSGGTETIGSLSGGGASGGNVTLSSSLIMGGNNNSTTFAGQLSGGGGLTKTGSGIFTLARSAGNSYTGATTVAAGTLLAMNSLGSSTGTGSVVVNSGGTLGGTGTIQGNITNSGTLAPGASAGALHANSNYTQNASGKLLIELTGTTAGSEYDQLLVAGSVALNGTLQVTFKDDFMPQENNAFDVLDFASCTGTFATLNLPALTGSLEWDVSRLYTAGILSVVLPGDFSGNGVVDAADYVFWRKGSGAGHTQTDYDTWRTHFGVSNVVGSAAGGDLLAPSGGQLSNVPEPAAILLLMVGSLHLLGWCRGRTTASV